MNKLLFCDDWDYRMGAYEALKEFFANAPEIPDEIAFCMLRLRPFSSLLFFLLTSATER